MMVVKLMGFIAFPNQRSTIVGVISAIMSSISGALGMISILRSFYAGAFAFIGLAVLTFGWACFARKDFYE
jgi:hypothetical protein